VAYSRVGSKGWVVVAFSVLDQAGVAPDDLSARLEELRAMEKRAFRRANLDKEPHHLKGLRTDALGRDPTTPPFAIYPFPPDVCALLTCDLLTYTSTLGWNQLAASFGELGFETKCPLPDRAEPSMSGASPVLIATLGEQKLAIKGGGIQQILFELIDLRSFARAARETLKQLGTAPRTDGRIIFANEKAVWK
jgi:hypothetical protein